MKNKFELISNFVVKSADSSSSERITIEGYANTTSKDRSGDVITESAWVQGGLNSYLKNPILLYNHNYDEPIGEVVDYNVSSKGLQIIAEVSKAAGKTYDLVKDGILRAFSVGFRIKDAEYDQNSDTFVIKDLDLYEISVVSVPANQDSIFSIRKSFEDSTEYDLFKNALITDSQAAEEVNASEVVKRLIETSIAEKLEESVSKLQPNITLEQVEQLIEEKTKKEQSMSVSVGESGAEKLVQELEKRLADSEKSASEALEGLRAELSEKAAEIKALNESKMRFKEKQALDAITTEDKEKAVLLGKITGKGIAGTEFGRNLVTKASGNHFDAGNTGDWEDTLSNNIYQEMRDRLVVEPLFKTLRMNTATMTIPYSGAPLAADAKFIGSAAYGSSDGSSTGTAVKANITDITLQTYKLAAKDSINDEEDEDTILAILPLIRDNLVTRMARKADNTILNSTGTVDTVTVFKGLTTLADDASATVTLTGNLSAAAITATHIHSLRKALGSYGSDPSQVVYVISLDAYYDLINAMASATSAGLTTVDQYGDNATILKGEVASLFGSKIVVSNEFPAKAVDVAWGVAVNMANFIKGELRSLKVDSEYSVVNQNNIIIATRRFGFSPYTPSKGVAVGVYPAS